jgi:pyruvate dehydrogenase E2 component (dihydrolipoamide acetyltransferase)
MATEIIIPKLGMDMEQGIFEKWLIAEGEYIKKGEPLFEMVTDKVNMEVEAETDGYLIYTNVEEGEILPVFTVIGYLGKQGESIPEEESLTDENEKDISFQLQQPIRRETEEIKEETYVSVDAVVSLNDKVRATPAARKMARDTNTDLHFITGSGPSGRVQLNDVKTYIIYAEKKKEINKQQIEEKNTLEDILITPPAKKLVEARNISILEIIGTGPEGRITYNDVSGYINEHPEYKEQKEHDGVRISPLAYRMATENNIDIHLIKGSGSKGKIVKKDVINAMENSELNAFKEKIPEVSDKQKGSRTVQMTHRQKIIAKRMIESVEDHPTVTFTTEIDMTNAISLRQKLRDSISYEYNVKMTYTDVILYNTARVLKEIPVINGKYTDQGILYHDYVNMGLAIGMEAGLIVPVIKKIDTMSLGEIAKNRQQVVQDVKENNIMVDSLTGSTFTVSNLGMYDITNFNSIINGDDSAILSVGAIKERPWVVDSVLMVRPVMTVSITVDHRIIDGLQSAKFLSRLKELLENPEIVE